MVQLLFDVIIWSLTITALLLSTTLLMNYLLKILAKYKIFLRVLISPQNLKVSGKIHK